MREEWHNDSPKGMEGFAFNLRRPIFNDIRLREALGMMFDFEWINANFYSGLDTRTKAFSTNRSSTSTGRPPAPLNARCSRPSPTLCATIFWKADGARRQRRHRTRPRNGQEGARIAAPTPDTGSRAHDLTKDGVPVAFEIMVKDRSEERPALNYATSLKRIGVRRGYGLSTKCNINAEANNSTFDMMPGQWIASSASPGNEQRMRLGLGQRIARGFLDNLAGASSPRLLTL